MTCNSIDSVILVQFTATSRQPVKKASREFQNLKLRNTASQPAFAGDSDSAAQRLHTAWPCHRAAPETCSVTPPLPRGIHQRVQLLLFLLLKISRLGLVFLVGSGCWGWWAQTAPQREGLCLCIFESNWALRHRVMVAQVQMIRTPAAIKVYTLHLPVW